MRILVVCADPGVPVQGPSGASAHLRGVVRALMARGHEVRVAAFRLHDRRGVVGEPLDAPVFAVPPRHWGWLPRRLRERGEWLDARRVPRAALADGWRPDLVWERHGLFSELPDFRAPHLIELNAPLALERAALDPAFAARVEGRALRRAHRVCAVSCWLTDWAVQQGCAPERVRHVPNGTDLPPGDRARGRARLGLEGLVIGFVGSMKPWHGLERLPAIVDALPEATGLLVGEGPVRIAHPRIRSTGYLEGTALADAVAAMDVALAPYPASAPPWFCPLKVLDYRAQGVPVVGTDVGDTARLVGEGGEILPPGAGPAAWAAAVRRQAGRRPAAWVRTWDEVVAECLAGLV